MEAIKPPARVYLDLTNACVLACRHCCTESGQACLEELSGPELEDLVRQVKALGSPSLVLSGGEAMLRPELPGLLELAVSLGLGVTLLTSGVLIDRAWARLLAGLGIRVKLSLDGVREETHDWLRGPGNQRRVLEALDLLGEVDCEGRAVHFTVNRRNAAELDDLPAFLLGRGITNLVVGMVKPSGRARQDSELLVDPLMALFIRQKVARLGMVGGLNIQRLSACSGEGFGCPAVCDKFGITATGRATTCAFFGTLRLGGSVRDHSLAGLWRENQVAGADFKAGPRCASCDALAASRGGCRARALYWTGDLNGPDPECCARNGKALPGFSRA